MTQSFACPCIWFRFYKMQNSGNIFKNLAKITKALHVDVHCLFLPVESSFATDSKGAAVIKKAIAENLRKYVDSVLQELTQPL